MDENVNGDAERIATEDEVTPDVSPLNVLIVEDDEMVLQSIEKLLYAVEKDCNITLARSASEAMTIIYRKFRETRKKIHLLLSDIHMPSEKEGISFLQAVRGHFAPPPFTAAMSGYPDSKELRGISDTFIEKPDGITSSRLKELVGECREYWKKMEELQDRHSVQYGAMENDETPDDFAPNILVVDDDQAYREWVSGAMKELDVPESKIFTVGNSEDALTVITNSMDSKGEIELVICDLNMQKGNERIDFMKTVKEMPNAPFVVICSKHKVTKEIKELADKVISKSGNIKRHLSEVLQAFSDWDTKGDDPETEKRILAAESSAYETSTFPAAASREEDLMKIEKEGLPLAILDFDGTLYRPKKPKEILLEEIIEFIDQHKPDATLPEHRLKIRNIIDSWRERKISYNAFIQDTSEEWGYSLKGKTVESIQALGREFYDICISNVPIDRSDSRFFGYVLPVIETLKKFGINPVIETGAPEEFLPPLKKLLRIKYSFGMRIRSSEGIYDGYSPFTAFAGQNRGKDGINKKLVQEMGHSIVFGMGNSNADEPIISAAIESRANQDLFGTAVIVNANDDDYAGYRKFRFSNAASDWQFEVLEESDSTTTKVAEVVKQKVQAALSSPRNLPKLTDLLFRKELKVDDIESKLSVHHNLQDVKKAVARRMIEDAVERMIDAHDMSPSEIRRLLETTDVGMMLNEKLRQMRQG